MQALKKISPIALVISLAFFSLGMFLGIHYFESTCFDQTFEVNKADMSSYERVQIFLKIFINNIKVALLSMICGSLSFGVVTSIILMYNGHLLTTLYLNLIYSYHLDQTTVLNYLVHAPLELFGIIIVSGIAIKNIQYLLARLKTGENFEVKHFFLHKELLIGTLFIFIAAIIETAII